VRAALLTDLETFEIRDVPAPRMQNDTDVLLRVEQVGVCGSDIHYYRNGRIGSQVVEFPAVIGHECSAVVEAVGDGVTRVRPGQRVVLDPLVACGQCDQCRAGRQHLCRNQVFLGCPGQLDGALVEQLVMPQGCCFPAPAAITPQRAVLLEPFPIALHATRLAGDLAGRRVGILGAGPIGLCVLAAAQAAGAAATYVTEIRDYRGRLAERQGATWVGNPQREDVVGAIRDREPGGLDAVFECAGQQDTMDQGLELLAPAGVLLLAGIGEFDRGSFVMETWRRRELRVQTVRRQNECVADAMELVASGAVALDALVTHHFPLAQTQQAFATVAAYADGVVKAVIEM